MIRLFHRPQVIAKRLIQGFRGFRTRKFLGQVVIADQVYVLILQGLLHLRTGKKIGHALTVHRHVLVADMPDGFHLLVIQGRVIQEHIAFTGFQLIQHPDETGLLLGRGLGGSIIPGIGEIIFLHRLYPIHDRQMIFLGQAAHQLHHLRIETGRSHMAGDMADLGNVLQGHLYLGPGLLLDLGQAPCILQNGQTRVGGIRRHHRQEIAIAIGQAGTMRQRTPFHVIPFAGKRQVKPDIYPRVLPQQPGGLGEPRGDNHNLYTGLHPILIPFHTRYIGGTERPHVIRTDDQAGIRGWLAECRPRSGEQQAAAKDSFYI